MLEGGGEKKVQVSNWWSGRFGVGEFGLKKSICCRVSWQGLRKEGISAGRSYSFSGWKIKVHLKRKSMSFSATVYLLGDCLLRP